MNYRLIFVERRKRFFEKRIVKNQEGVNMRKILTILLTVAVAMAFGCGKSEPPGAAGESPQNQGVPAKKNADSQRNPGRKDGSQKIDVDKLDIPDQLKDAIKSGQIPPERVREIIAQASEGDAKPVNVEAVRRENLNSYLIINGIVEPERTIEIFSRLSAYVKEIVKEEGVLVRENDTLALLDDTEIRISHEQAKIALEQAKLSLDEAEQNYTRNQELIKREMISEQEFQTQEAVFKQRQLDYKNSQEAYKNLELQLNWTKIRSLSDGYITERLIEVGDRVNSNQQVYTIEDFSPLLIRVYVPTSDAIKLKTGMSAEVMTDIIPGRIFTGTVKLINPRIDVQTGTVKVTVEVFDKTLSVKPGMFVEVRIVVGQKENVLVIPRKAVLYKQNLTHVFVMQQSQVSQRQVELGLTEEDMVEITGGLEEGEKIITVGVEGLKEGQRVKVLQ